MTSKTLLLGNVTHLPLLLRVPARTSAAFLMIHITCGLAHALVLTIILGLETQMEIDHVSTFEQEKKNDQRTKVFLSTFVYLLLIS